MLATRVLPDPAAVGVAVAAALRGRPLIGWPVGRTTRPVAAALHRGDLATAVLMDDYVADGARIPVTHPCSCRAAGLRDLPVDPDSVWSPDPADPAAYDERIGAAGGLDAFVVALGASDGHVALNPPGTPADSRTRVVEIATSTRRDNLATWGLTSLEEVPTHGVTVGLATITDARSLLVVAHGAGKRDVVRRLRHADGFDPAWPMTAVLGHPDVQLFVDEAAAR